MTTIDIDKIIEEAEKPMKEAFERWKGTVTGGSSASGASATDGTHTHYIPAVSSTSVGTSATFSYFPAPEFISVSMVVDEKWIGTTVKAKPEPAKPAKPIKRYSKTEFKKKLEKLCG